MVRINELALELYCPRDGPGALATAYMYVSSWMWWEGLGTPDLTSMIIPSPPRRATRSGLPPRVIDVDLPFRANAVLALGEDGVTFLFELLAHVGNHCRMLDA